MLEIRATEAASRGDRLDYHAPEAVTEWHGMIYAAYHFPTGRWYVGQTINTVQTRARQHWWARRSAKDLLHLALAEDADPMMWAAFPLERVPQDLWQTPPTERQANWRKDEVAKFRAVATPRERFWTDKLQTMWPKGWNSQYPGKPVTKGPHTRCGATACTSQHGIWKWRWI